MMGVSSRVSDLLLLLKRKFLRGSGRGEIKCSLEIPRKTLFDSPSCRDGEADAARLLNRLTTGLGESGIGGFFSSTSSSFLERK